MEKDILNIEEFISGKVIIPLSNSVGLLVAENIDPIELWVCVGKLAQLGVVNEIEQHRDLEEYRKRIHKLIDIMIDEEKENYDVSGKNLS